MHKLPHPRRECLKISAFELLKLMPVPRVHCALSAKVLLEISALIDNFQFEYSYSHAKILMPSPFFLSFLAVLRGTRRWILWALVSNANWYKQPISNRFISHLNMGTKPAFLLIFIKIWRRHKEANLCGMSPRNYQHNHDYILQ